MESEKIRNIVPIEEYTIPEGLPVDSKKWEEAIRSYNEARQSILNDTLSGILSPRESKKSLAELRVQIEKTYLDKLNQKEDIA